MPPRRIVPPDAPATPMEARGERLGITFRRGRTWASNSYISLQAAEFAREYGGEWAFQRRMFKAYFDDLENIGDLDTVVRIGAEAGLHEASLRAALEEGRYREMVDEGIGWSRAIGVNAIPTFVFNEQYGIVGSQELPAFRQMMAKIDQTPKQ